MTLYNVTLQTLSPLHIGDGNELREGFDFHVDDKEEVTYFLNQDAILDEKADEIDDYAATGRYPLPGELLASTDFERKNFISYKLPGKPNTKKRNVFSPIRSFVKNAFGFPYIPGSSLKGALRRALGWHGWNKSMLSKMNPPTDLQHVDDEIEKYLFGNGPNYDLLRALQVSDLMGKGNASQCLRVAQISTWTRHGKGVPISVEAMKGGMSLTGTIKIDDFLFSETAEPTLGFSSKKDWVYGITAKNRSCALAQMTRLAGWFENIPDGRPVAAIYRNWMKNISTLSDNQTFVQIGWGSGWDGITYGSQIQDSDPQEFENIIKRYDLQPTRKKSIVRQAGDFFSESKRVEVQHDKPKNPFGWALLEMKEA